MALTQPPVPTGPSSWDGFPDGDHPADAPVAVGGDLSPATLVGAYRRGIFPWPADDPEVIADRGRRFGTAVAAGTIPNLAPERPPTLDLPWWSPDPRGVIQVGDGHVSHSLRRRLRSCGWTTTLNHSFVDVVRGCRRSGPDAWMTSELVAAYAELRALSWAHSIEVWDEVDLVGGMYGVLVGCVFVGESMFHARTGASKVAMVDFDARLTAAGGVLLDVQFVTPHLRSMGAVEMPRERFLSILRDVRDADIRLVTDQLPVNRLA